MASRRHEHQEEIRFRTMRLIEENPSVSTREIARIIGISNGSAYYCVNALLDKGYVKLKNFARSKKKANYLYEFTPRGLKAKAALTVKFLERKRTEYDALRNEIERIEKELNFKNEENELIDQVYTSRK